MEIDRLWIFKSPFDMLYNNVPDMTDYNSIANLNTSFEEYYLNWLLINCKYNSDIELPISKSFAPNDTYEIVVRTKLDDEWEQYNYAVLKCNNGDDIRYFCYFIKEIKVINGLLRPSIKLSLIKDFWVKYIKNLCKYPYRQKISERHEDFYIDGDELSYKFNAENIIEKNVAHKREIKFPLCSEGYRDDIDILWARYKLNPTVDFYYSEQDTLNLLGRSTSSDYGVLSYVYLPVKAYLGSNEVSKIIMHFDNIETGVEFDLTRGFDNLIKIPEVDSILSLDLTFYAPILRSDETYNISNNVLTTTVDWSYAPLFIGTEVGIGKYILTDRYHHKRTYTRNYNLLPSYDTPIFSENDWTRYMLFNYYPYTKYTIRLPNGNIEIKSNYILKSLKIRIEPTDTSIEYYVEASDVNGNKVLSSEYTRNFNEASGTIPLTIDAYKNFLVNSSMKYNINYQYQLDKLNLDTGKKVGNFLIDTTETTLSVGANVIEGDYSEAVTGTIKGGRNTFNTATGIAENAMTENYIKNIREADIAQMQLAAANVPSPSSDTSDLFFQDRVIVYIDTPIFYDDLKDDYFKCRYFGNKVVKYDIPLINFRHVYDFVKTDKAVFTQIFNPLHQSIISNIFNKGVRKWHIDVLDKTYLADGALNKAIDING